MLGPQPPHSADQPPNARQHTPENVATATTQMMWAVALATTRASLASTAHGLALWSRMLRGPIGPWQLTANSPAHGPDANLDTAPDAATIATPASAPAGGSAQEAASTTTPADPPGEEAAFASYRSSGGHASAQVITHH
jgi:hypothetical protein